MKLIYQTLTVLFALAVIVTPSGFIGGMFGLAGLVARLAVFGSLTIVFAALS